MEQPPPRRVYRIVIVALALVTLVVLGVIGAALIASRPPSAEDIAATLTALPSPTLISGDHQLLISWLSTSGPVRDLDDALPGVVLGFDVALEIWERGCAIYDRIRVDVYDGPPEQRVHRLTVRVPMDDLLQWRGGKFGDRELIARLESPRNVELATEVDLNISPEPPALPERPEADGQDRRPPGADPAQAGGERHRRGRTGPGFHPPRGTGRHRHPAPDRHEPGQVQG